MTTIKKIFFMTFIISSSINYADNKTALKLQEDFNQKKPTQLNPNLHLPKKDKYTSQDKYIGLQFPPVDEKEPYSQEEFDEYVAGLLDKIIKLDNEIHNNPRLKPTPSIHDFAVEESSNHVLFSKNKSFGWNDPIAIITALFYNGAAETPNEFIQTIQKSVEFPGHYKACLKATGLYNTGDRSAHSELAAYIKQGPTKISKYKNLEEITTLKDLNDENNLKFKDSEKIILQTNLPSLQGELECNCYAHGCDVKGVVYFNLNVLRYLIQNHNGNRHLHNSPQKKVSESAHKKNDDINKKNELESVIQNLKIKCTLPSEEQSSDKISEIQTLKDDHSEIAQAISLPAEDEDDDDQDENNDEE